MPMLSQASIMSVLSEDADPLFPYPLSGSTVATSASAYPPSSQLSQTKFSVPMIPTTSINGFASQITDTRDILIDPELEARVVDGDPRTEEEKKKEMIEKVLKRVEMGKAARQFHKRLSLAKFKAVKGWSHLTLEEIEPLYNRQIEEEESKRKNLYRRSMPSLNETGLFDHLLSPSRGPVRAPSRPNHQGSPVRRRQASNASTSRLSMQPGSPLPQSSLRGTSQQPAHLNSSDRSFNGTANEFLSAADALNSMSKGTPNSPSHLDQTRNKSEEESDRESAELMLYLAQSPSPAQPGRIGGTNAGAHSNGEVKGRRLFEGSEFGSAHQPLRANASTSSSTLLGPPADLERVNNPNPNIRPSPVIHNNNNNHITSSHPTTTTASALLPPRYSTNRNGARVNHSLHASDFLQSPSVRAATTVAGSSDRS